MTKKLSASLKAAVLPLAIEENTRQTHCCDMWSDLVFLSIKAKLGPYYSDLGVPTLRRAVGNLRRNGLIGGKK